MAKSDLYKSFIALMNGDATISGIIGTEAVHAQVAMLDRTGEQGKPAIVYDASSDTPEYGFDGRGAAGERLNSVSLDVYAVHDTFTDSLALIEAVEDAMEGWSGTTSTIDVSKAFKVEGSDAFVEIEEGLEFPRRAHTQAWVVWYRTIA